jgi:UDP-N-acetylglucosamine/UDP-N-acetylgalactosamine diphosphorylase
VEFLERVTARGTGLSFHVARKKVPHFDPATGTAVNPTTENALKFELFVFDALPMANRWLAVETRREEEFAPLKNATGADSPEAVKQAIIALHGGWLERAGVRTNSHPVEVSPLFALDADELRAKIPASFTVNEPTHLR